MLWNKCTVQQATEKNFSSATSVLKQLCPEHRLLKQVTKLLQKYNLSNYYVINTLKNVSLTTSALKTLCSEHRLLKQVTELHQKNNSQCFKLLWNKYTVHQVTEKCFLDNICSHAALPWTQIIEASHKTPPKSTSKCTFEDVPLVEFLSLPCQVRVTAGN